MKKTIIILAIIAAVLIILPLLVGDIEVKQLDDETRSKLGLRFIKLTDGTVHYELQGPQKGEMVVLVHGNAAPYFSWEKNVTALVNAGFRVLTYDLYGFGYTDRPDVEYNRALYDRQLVELLEKLNIQGPVNLVGTSQGGSISVQYTANHPNGVKRLALLSPYINILPMRATITIVTTPGLGDYLARLVLDRINLNYPNKCFANPEAIPEDYTKKYLRQLSFKGFKRARLSNLRSDSLTDFRPEYKKVGGMNIPILLTWGTADRVIKADSIQNIKEAMPNLEYHEIKDAGHLAHYEKPAEVNSILLEFLRK